MGWHVENDRVVYLQENVNPRHAPAKAHKRTRTNDGDRGLWTPGESFRKEIIGPVSVKTSVPKTILYRSCRLQVMLSSGMPDFNPWMKVEPFELEAADVGFLPT